MAQRVEHFAVTVPAGTAQAAPAETSLPMAPGELRRLEVFVPPGHAGLTGWRLAQAHQAVIPRTPGEFVIADSEVIGWDLDGFLNNGNWQLQAFNTDEFSHVFYLRFLLDEIGRPAGAGRITPIALVGQLPGGAGFVPAEPESPELLESAEPLPAEPPPPEPLPPEPEPLPPEPEPLPPEPEPELPPEPEPEPPPPLEIEPEPVPVPVPEPVVAAVPVVVASGPQPAGEYHRWAAFHVRADGRRVSDRWNHYISGPRKGDWVRYDITDWGVNPAAKPPVPPWEAYDGRQIEGRSFPDLRWRLFEGEFPYFP